MLITDTGVPQRFIDTDDWGGEVMLRLDDGWCAALDRDTMMCTIYELRPLICREFEMGAHQRFDADLPPGPDLRLGQELDAEQCRPTDRLLERRLYLLGRG